MIEAIEAITLGTHDMKCAVRFYRELGFIVHFGGEQSHFTTLHSSTTRVNLVSQPSDWQWSWWGRVIFLVSDVDAWYERLVALGLSPDDEPRNADWGERYFHLTDPDGHQLSFVKPLQSTEAIDRQQS